MSIDLIIVGVFFAVIFLIGIFERKKVTLDDYWVNSRKTNRFVLIATVSSTFLGVGSLLSNAGIAYSGGGLATLILMASFFVGFILFGKFFAPKIHAFGVETGSYTVPDYLEHRYSRRMRIVGLLLNIISLGLFLSLQILGIGIFVSAVGGLDPILATVVGGAIIVGYTTIGGLRADIRTDVFQFAVMLSLLIFFLPFLFVKGGGFEAIGNLPISFLSGQEFAPWYVYVVGFFFLGATNFVAADMWQRAYAGDSSKNVKWAMKWSGVVTGVFLLLGTLMGIFGRILIPGVSENLLVPELLHLYLPSVIYGIVIAGFFAAIMSSADTNLLLMSMTIVHDFYQKTLKRPLTDKQTLRASRWVTFILGLAAVCVAVTIFSVVHLAIESISFYVALLPAIIFGFYWKRARENAAFWSTVAGFLATFIFLFIDPVQAFIPGIIVSFTVFILLTLLGSRKTHKV